jgi:hypothetical protein
VERTGRHRGRGNESTQSWRRCKRSPRRLPLPVSPRSRTGARSSQAGGRSSGIRPLSSHSASAPGSGSTGRCPPSSPRRMHASSKAEPLLHLDVRSDNICFREGTRCSPTGVGPFAGTPSWISPPGSLARSRGRPAAGGVPSRGARGGSLHERLLRGARRAASDPNRAARARGSARAAAHRASVGGAGARPPTATGFALETPATATSIEPARARTRSLCSTRTSPSTAPRAFQAGAERRGTL